MKHLLEFVSAETWIALWLLVVAAVVVAVVSAVLNHRLVKRVMQAIGAVSEGVPAAALSCWWQARTLGLAAGLAAGAGVTAFLVGWFGMDRGHSAVEILILGSLAGASLGEAWGGAAALASRRTVASERPRRRSVAHMRAMTLMDYVPRWVRWSGWLVLILWVFMSGIGAYGWGWPRASSIRVLTPSFYVAIVTLVLLLGTELGGRLIVGKSSRSSSAEELRLDDALRCFTIRDLALSALIAAAFAVTLTVGDTLAALGLRYSPEMVDLASGGVSIAAIVTLLFFAFVPPRRLVMAGTRDGQLASAS